MRLRVRVGAALACAALAGLAVTGCTASSQPAAAISPAASASSAAGGPASRLTVGAGGAAPRDFVAVSYTGGPKNNDIWVQLGDAATGAITGKLVPGLYDGMHADGAAVGRDGTVWVTYSKGPAVTQMGFGPAFSKPATCGNEVVKWNLQAATPHATVYQRSGDNVLLGQAVPSPDGQLVAYTEQPCELTSRGVYLRVTAISSGKNWTIGQGLLGCHILTTPAWSADGTQLLEGYAAANQPYGTDVSEFCTGPGTERLLRLAATTAQPGVSGQVTSPDGNCQVESVAALAGGGALALQSCGRSPDYARDFAALLVVAAGGQHRQTISLGGCSAAGQLAGDSSGGSVLVTATVDCTPTAARPPRITDDLWDYSGGRLRLVAAAPATDRAPTQVAW